VFSNRRDGRIMLVVPWGDSSLIGATDTNFRGDPGAVAVEQSDIDYLLTEVRSLFPEVSVSESDIVVATAGVRPLLRSDTASPSARSREHRIVRLGQNLLSIAGGKYTTYRLIAQQTVDTILRILKKPAIDCRTAEVLLPNRRPAQTGERISDSPPVFSSDIVHACEQEMAITLSDVMRRRTRLALSRNGGEEAARRVARLMAPVLHWDADQERNEINRYLEKRKQNLP